MSVHEGKERRGKRENLVGSVSGFCQLLLPLAELQGSKNRGPAGSSVQRCTVRARAHARARFPAGCMICVLY